MKAQRKRALAVASAGAAFTAMFLWQASPMAWRPMVLAVGGMSLVVFLVISVIALVERSDTKAAVKVLARNRAIEADPVERRKWERRMVASR
jgi:FtsH-binding integral membrane protein